MGKVRARARVVDEISRGPSLFVVFHSVRRILGLASPPSSTTTPR
jgi:hypothetical protein